MAKELTDDQRRLAEKNRRYWATREEEALRHYIKDEKQYDRQIQNIYKDMLDNIQKEIDGFYGRYASKEGISINEAKKRVTEADIKAYERKAKRYVKEKDFSKQANEEMRLYNLTMKVNRLELLKANIGLDLVKGHDELDRYIGEILQGRTMEELERQAGILGNTITINSKMAHAIPNSSFHNATFSDRIWMHQSLLKADLSKLLQTGLIQGKNPRVLAREIESRFNTSRYNAERLMRTELARVQIEVQKASLERNGFTQFEFLANSGCCDICQEKNKKIFKLDDFKYGDNAPPLHPHCRCTIAPYEDTTEFDAWLNHVGSGGETTWDEWNESGKAAWNKRRTTESGKYSGIVNRVGTNSVDLDYIKSSEFRRKFNRITDNTAINEALRKYADAMLTHRRNTDGEDLYIIHAETGQLLLREIAGNDELGVVVSYDKIAELKSKYYGEMIGIHNHPTNIPPTGSDFGASGYRGYKFGVVVTHDGRVYTYECGNRPFLPQLLDERVDKYLEKPYNLSIEKAHQKVLSEFEKEYGISWKEIL